MADELLTPPKPLMPFIGREAELDWLRNETRNRERFLSDMPLVVTGEAGIGKTALVAKFVTQLPETERAVWIRCSRFDRDTAAFQVALRRSSGERPPRRVVTILDGADEILEEDFGKMFFEVINYKIIRTVIVTTRRELKLRGQRVLRLEALPNTEAKLLVEQDATGTLISEDSMERILEIVRGHPQAIALVSKMARSMEPRQLQRVLHGHLYDLDDAGKDEKKHIIELARPVIVTANQNMVAELKKHPDDIFKLTSRQYEELIAELMSDMGYDVTLTKATRDGGKDILASIRTDATDFLMLVEAKRYGQRHKVGVSLVRALYGTLCDYQANSGMLVTTSSFSKDAKEFGGRHQYQLRLRDFTDVASWIQRYGNRKVH
jgi:restriction system protein